MTDNKIHGEDYFYKDILYAIKIYKVKDSFLGRWICTHCGKKGGSSKLCKDFDEALSFTKQNLSTHKISHEP